MRISRRRFARTIGSVAASLAAHRFVSGETAEAGLRLGLNTYSLRALPHEEAIPIIIRTMKQSGIVECELLSNQVEPPNLAPPYPASSPSGPRVLPTPEQLEERKKVAAALAEWRLSVPMTYFEQIRSRFAREGLRIRSYLVRLGSSAEEIDRLFLMAKALGADSVNARVPEPLTATVAAAADKHQMLMGLQVTDLDLLQRQLAASKYFRIDPDIGDLTKARTDALDFVRAKYQLISSLDLKDAIVGGKSVPFGEGESHMADVVRFFKDKRLPITAYIDCDYAGTGTSPEEVLRCAKYVHGLMA